MCVCIYVSRYIYVYMSCIYSDICIHIHIRPYTHTYTHTYIYIYISQYKIPQPCMLTPSTVQTLSVQSGYLTFGPVFNLLTLGDLLRPVPSSY